MWKRAQLVRPIHPQRKRLRLDCQEMSLFTLAGLFLTWNMIKDVTLRFEPLNLVVFLMSSPDLGVCFVSADWDLCLPRVCTC
jgi:hypothetical protein